VARVDGARFARILANLTDNALRYGPPDGTVTLTVTRSADTAMVTVQDQGRGIAEHEADRIFDRMVRLDDARSTEGSGLGLTIARTFARAHGGDVVYDGTAFVVTVPV
jgi:two-component system OmpR family sensor kinase